VHECASQTRWLLDYARSQQAGRGLSVRGGGNTDHIEKAFVFAGMGGAKTV